MKATRLVLAAAALLGAACSSEPPTEPPGPPAAVELVHAPSSIAVTGVDSFRVKVSDSRGRGVPNVEVRWLLGGWPAAELTPGVTVTDEGGIARAALRAGTRTGEVMVVAEAVTTSGPRRATMVVSITPGPAVRITAPTGLWMGVYGQRTVAATATDAHGNPVTGQVAFSSSNPAVVEVLAGGTLSAKAAGSVTVTAAAGGAQASFPVQVAAAPLSEDFDLENGGRAQINFSAFRRWTVAAGNVDLIGAGSEWDFIPGNGLYVDMEGYMQGGRLESAETFALPAGTYTLSFRLAGSQRGDVNTVTVTLGSAFGESFTLAGPAPFTTFTRTVVLAQPATVRLAFQQGGADGFGLLLDNVTLTKN